jgi:two-component system, OmpR family, sensor histidine kinase CiaH
MFQRLRNKFLFTYFGTVVLLVLLFFSITLFTTYQKMERDAIGEIIRSEQKNYSPELPLINSDVMPPRFLPPIMITLDNKNKMIDVKSYTKMENSYYVALTEAALSKNSEKGKVKIDNAYYEYSIKGSRIVFLDVSRDMEMLFGIMTTFLWIAIPMLILLLVISYYFSKNWVKPIEQVYTKQKEFIANASHELKTPLTAISANVDVLLEGVDKDEKKWLSYIQLETERMTKLTGSLLYLAKMDLREANSKIEKINISHGLEKHVMTLEAVFYEKNIETEINIVPDLIVKADREEFYKLIEIFTDNAIKYSDGKIQISLEKVQSQAKLIIFNTGTGISEADLPKIWDRFYRGDESRASVGGFGLGLPIAKAIVESYNGAIKVESEPGKWTRFIIELPIA